VVAYEVHRLGGEVQDFAAALGERAQEIVRLATDQAAGLGAQIQTEIVEERAAEALVETANRLEARLIVVGTRGESPLLGALVGSTPHKLVQVAERPVLVVPA
jgi:nucleotide-binding universal stress UspA family protein